jgi:hypothetical protein
MYVNFFHSKTVKYTGLFKLIVALYRFKWYEQYCITRFSIHSLL